ncbi:MAG TPA: MATE family efflux transporter [Dongiaceae bacterium]|jgi:MATE family multidrug resistance protein|nr:MATE family efflux transporter [Dongiaceae bacterium]
MSSELTQAAVAADRLAVAPNWRREVRDTLILTAPIAAALLAEMGMGVIDYSMSGHLGPTALAAAGLGLQLLFTPMFWGMGAITATGAVGAQAHGAGNAEAVSESMRQGFLMATLLSLPIMAIALIALPLLPLVNKDAEVVDQVGRIILIGLPWIPLVYWFTVIRNFVTVMQRPAIVSICAIAGLPVSFLSNYAFMYGNWGAPNLGAAAVGVTGVIVALLHLVMIVIYVESVPELRRYRIFARLLHFNGKMMAELFRIGIPIAMSYLFETGLFFTITVLMGVISTEALAAHNVVLNICAMTFMIPYALSQAATVRVGYAIGAGQPEAARRAGYVAIWLGVGWMVLAASTMLTVPNLLTAIYLDLSDPANAAAAQLAASLFVIAAVFQIVDGTQVTTQGALRGLKDTKVPMVLCGLGYWVFGLGSGATMGFALGYGATGLWWGLAIGLAVSASLLFRRWQRMSARIIR